jgi:3-oxoacyl-[acyl-carrier protein] reductase
VNDARLSSLSRSIAGRVALVTGAASGMGRGTARLLADEGACVAVTDRDGDGAAAVADEITDVHGADAAAWWALDVASPTSIDAVVDEIVERFGPIDILVNNAGVSLPAPLDGDGAAYDDAWEATIAVNLTAHQRLVRACLPFLRRNADGRVVNIASTEGLGAQRWISPYTASKHGVIGLTKTAALEYAERGIRVNAVCPGVIDTAMVERFTGHQAEAQAALVASEPIGRMGHPEEIADAVVWLSSSHASFVTGQAIAVDGGFVAR